MADATISALPHNGILWRKLRSNKRIADQYSPKARIMVITPS
jgi:hypothetical protein